MSHNPKILLFELNEFSVDLLSEASKVLSLPYVQKLLEMQRVETWTDDTYESDFLEPWVQWVSVHTGQTSQDHFVKHLGDISHLDHLQLWEVLSKQGVTSGVWGPMNASRGIADQCLFFVPDPWTVSEEAYPDELGDFLSMIRYLSQNYLNKSVWTITKKVGKFLMLIAKWGLLGKLFAEMPQVIKNAVKFGAKNFIFISVADYFSTLLFLKYKERYNPDFTLLFLNSLAHLQHHHWKGRDYAGNEKLKYGLTYLDRILEKIFASMGENEKIVVTNALSQKNTNEEKPWVLYRQHDQESFLRAIGIKYRNVEPLMTHDAHIFFHTSKEAKEAKALLESASINGKKLFMTESYPDMPEKLFYRIDFTDEVDQTAVLSIGGKELHFFDLFASIVVRTGKHIPSGQLFTTLPVSQEMMYNHEVYHLIYEIYK